MAQLSPRDVPEPVRAWLPEPLTLQFPKQGQTATVAFCEGAPLVIKRCRGAVYATWLEQEHRALQALAETDLPLPRAVGLHVVSGEEPETWLVTTRLPGEPLWDVIARTPDPALRAEWFRALGRLTARIHSTPIPATLSPAEPERWFERVFLRARRASRRWLQDLAARLDRDRPPYLRDVLIHGDLTIDNVLAHEGRLTGAIDWGGAGPGDPRYDVTLALATGPDLRLEPAVVAAFFDGYGGEPLPEDLRTFFTRVYDRP